MSLKIFSGPSSQTAPLQAMKFADPAAWPSRWAYFIPPCLSDNTLTEKGGLASNDKAALMAYRKGFTP